MVLDFSFLLFRYIDSHFIDILGCSIPFNRSDNGFIVNASLVAGTNNPIFSSVPSVEKSYPVLNVQTYGCEYKCNHSVSQIIWYFF